MYYVVWSGRRTGIFDNWAECKESTHKFSGAKFKSYDTIEEAEAALNGTPQYIPNQVEKFTGGICVDASARHNGKPDGTVEWRGVENGVVLFSGGPIAGTNNIGEFLAICDALRLSDKNVYSDSRIAIQWVINKNCATKFKEDLELIRQAVEWLKANPKSHHRVFFWNNKAWGENPADYGRK